MNPASNQKKVFVSGCYDMLHSGHIAFFEDASQHGDLYVGIGSDKTIFDLKGRKTINSDAERLYMIKSIRYVKEAWINKGSGLLDFEEDLRNLHADIFFVNEDGHSPEKEKLCKDLGIQYLVGKRIPSGNLPQRSTTALRNECLIPYRIDLAGGWLDQPFVSKYYPGPVITISIEPDYDFNDRSGMSTSTRKKAIDLWQIKIPEGDKIKLAKTLFCYENPPGVNYVSGSQDALGIVLPGINYLFYEREEYWPSKVISEKNEAIIQWLETHLRLLALKPRTIDLNLLDNMHVSEKGAQKLAKASNDLWKAIKDMDPVAFGEAMISSFNAQVEMFPNMIHKDILSQIEIVKGKCLGYKLSGAGGGGYMILFTMEEIPNTLKIRIRR